MVDTFQDMWGLGLLPIVLLIPTNSFKVSNEEVMYGDLL